MSESNLSGSSSMLKSVTVTFSSNSNVYTSWGMAGYAAFMYVFGTGKPVCLGDGKASGVSPVNFRKTPSTCFFQMKNAGHWRRSH
jgi:hypothetical protein